LANCLLVLSLHWSFDHEQVKELGLSVAGLVAGASSQLGSLYTETILGLGTEKTV